MDGENHVDFVAVVVGGCGGWLFWDNMSMNLVTIISPRIMMYLLEELDEGTEPKRGLEALIEVIRAVIVINN